MFATSFWESDFISHIGFETIITRLKEGTRTCRDIEEFLKQRSKAEEDFAKSLQKIAKGERGVGETGTMKSSVDVLRAEADVEAGLHARHAQYLAEEANKLAEFREKQREERRRHEDAMHKIQKTKADSYRKMQNCKTTYESKYRASEKADLDYERVKFSTKPKEVERARKSQHQSQQAAAKADEDYKSSVDQLEIHRQTWEQEHRKTCEIFQRLEEERLQNLRNVLWVYSNLGSDIFVDSDDSREKMRQSLEYCDIDSDLRDFATKKGTGTRPLDHIPYISCAIGTQSSNHQITNNVSNTHASGRPPKQDEYSLAEQDTYSTINLGFTQKKALYDYSPQTAEEMQCKVGDQIVIKKDHGDGWLWGTNVRSGQEGLVPATYVGDH